jgi:hypothetical protein
MTIRQRGKEGICESQFWVDGTFYQFTFNGKDGRPLITSKKKAKEHEYELKREIKMGTNLKESDLKNFAKFFDEIYMDYSQKHKTYSPPRLTSSSESAWSRNSETRP